MVANPHPCWSLAWSQLPIAHPLSPNPHAHIPANTTFIYIQTTLTFPLPLDRAHFHLSIGFSKAYATINVSWDLRNQFLQMRSRRAIHFIPNPLDFTSLSKWVGRKNVQVRLLIKSHIFQHFSPTLCPIFNLQKVNNLQSKELVELNRASWHRFIQTVIAAFKKLYYLSLK